MKLSALFAKYLYQNKELRLPGIGVFSIDPAIMVPDISDRDFPDFLQQIQYVQKPVSAPDEAFIDFIRKETGKIKPLAESDLDSFLSDGKILLNIDKPFHIEGIGSLQKSKAGQYTFIPGEPVLKRLEGISEKGDDTARKKPVYTEDGIPSSAGKKLLIAAAVIAGIALIIWGGYSLYNRNATLGDDTSAGNQAVVAPVDSSRANVLLDSVKNIIDSTLNKPSGTYKFIIEKTSSKARAFRRYNQLKDNLTDIRMDTKDSIHFDLYFVLPATHSDTARVRDSLKLWYASKRVLVVPN